MAWPKRRRKFNHLQSSNSVLGGHFSTAEQNIEKLCKRVIYATMDFRYTAKDVIPWLFAADTIERLKAAYGLTPLYDKWVSYDLTDDVTLTIDYEDHLKMLSAADTMLEINHQQAKPLVDLVDHVKAIHDQFQCVLETMRWLDTHCTAGAVRHYWPTMGALAPDHEELQGGEPVRYVVPKQPIGPMLELIRETQATVASALLLPDKTYDAKAGMKLEISTRKFTHKSGVEIRAQSLTLAL